MSKEEVGTIKWFGGYNHQQNKENNFGFIELDGSTEDIFVHEDNLTCSPNDLEEDTIVFFEVRTRKNRNQNEAIHVRLPDFNKNQDLLLCARSVNEDIFIVAIEFMIKRQTKIEKEFAEFLCEKFSSIRFDTNYPTRLVDIIPDQAFYDFTELRTFLDSSRHIKVLSSLFLIEKDNLVKSRVYSDLKDILKKECIGIYSRYESYPTVWRSIETINNGKIKIEWHTDSYKEDIWDTIPSEVLSDSEIYRLIPDHKKISLLFKKWNETENDKKKEHISAELVLISSNHNNLKYLPESLKTKSHIFTVLKSTEQVNIAWGRIGEFWNFMSRDAKIYAAFRAAKENENLDIINYADHEEDLLIKMVLFLLGRRLGKSALLEIAHNMLGNYVQTEAWKSTTPLDMGPLLGGCGFLRKVNHCEARKWAAKEGGWKKDEYGNELAFCPRTQKTCIVKTPIHSKGAHIYAITSDSWENWTLTEFFASLNIKPKSKANSLNKNDTYLLKMAGWINRLNEIRERMKCAECEKILIPDTRYAFHPAKYNSTVASCPDGHGEGIYFNHCWNCQHIIDSRESNIKFSHYYLCIRCGAGPKPGNSKKSWYEEELNIPEPSSFSQGDKCPKCGTLDMIDSDRDKDIKKCQHPQCQHYIHLKGRSVSLKNKRTIL